jgi:hypothetical protein
MLVLVGNTYRNMMTRGLEDIEVPVMSVVQQIGIVLYGFLIMIWGMNPDSDPEWIRMLLVSAYPKNYKVD